MDDDVVSKALAEAVSIVFASIMLSWLKLVDELSEKVKE